MTDYFNDCEYPVDYVIFFSHVRPLITLYNLHTYVCHSVSVVVGKCTRMSPCHQQCVDIPTGGYECTCWPGYKLHYNGFSCVPGMCDVTGNGGSMDDRGICINGINVKSLGYVLGGQSFVRIIKLDVSNDPCSILLFYLSLKGHPMSRVVQRVDTAACT